MDQRTKNRMNEHEITLSIHNGTGFYKTGRRWFACLTCSWQGWLDEATIREIRKQKGLPEFPWD